MLIWTPMVAFGGVSIELRPGGEVSFNGDSYEVTDEWIEVWLFLNEDDQDDADDGITYLWSWQMAFDLVGTTNGIEMEQLVYGKDWALEPNISMPFQMPQGDWILSWVVEMRWGGETQWPLTRDGLMFYKLRTDGEIHMKPSTIDGGWNVTEVTAWNSIIAPPFDGIDVWDQVLAPPISIGTLATLPLGDLNGDGIVENADRDILCESWAGTGPCEPLKLRPIQMREKR